MEPKTIEQKMKEFEAHARPLIQWLNENCHPHHTIIITPVGAELLEGNMAVPVTDYVLD